MGTLLLVILVLSGLGIIGLVLIQHGKGADMGASFGSGASQTVFGSAGTGNVLTKSTTWLAVVFFAVCLALAFMARRQAESGVQAESLLADPTAATVIQKSGEPTAATEAPAQQAAGDVPAQPPAQSDTPAAPAAVEPEKQTTQN